MRYLLREPILGRVERELNSVPKKIANKVIRKALRQLGNGITKDIKAGVTWNDPEVRRNIKVKIKTYKRGKLFWMGVGALKGADDYVLLRARWYNDGWTPFPKGTKHGKKGKNWRSRLRNLGGTKIYKTDFINNAYRKAIPEAPRKVYQSIIEALSEIKSR